MAATLAQLESALLAADRAGDMQAARVLAAAVMRARADNTMAATIPVDTSLQAPPATRPEPAGPLSVGDRAVGALEAAGTVATGMTTGAIGAVQDGLAQAARELLSGNFGTQQAAQAIERAVSEGAKKYTLMPRTPAGVEAVGAVGEVMQNIPPVAGVTGTLVNASSLAGPAAAQVAAAAKPAVTRGIKAVSTLPRRALEMIGKGGDDAAAAAAAATPGTRGSVGAAGTDMAVQRRTTAEMLGFTGDKALTTGQATRDPAQLKFETEAAKMPAEGAPLRQRLVAQNEHILSTFDHWADQTGAQATTPRAVGLSVDKALVRQAMMDKAAVNAAYRAARKSPEAQRLVDLESVVTLGEGDRAITSTPLQFLNDQPAGLPSSGLADAARQFAVKIGVAEQRDGKLVPKPATVAQMEDWRAAIGQSVGYEAPDIRAATILKGLIDGQTEPLAGPLYRQARGLRRRFAQNYEDHAAIARLLETKRGTSDRRVAYEDVFEQTVLKGSLDDVRTVRRVLQRAGPEGNQAWKDLQGQTALWIKGRAERNSATDSAGNRVVSVSALDDAIKTLDADGRLEFIFGKQGAQQMRDIRELAMIARTVPPEAAANTSNTASTLLASFVDAGVIGSTGGAVPIPIASLIRVVRQNVKDRALRNRIEESLRGLDKRAPGKRKPPISDPARGPVH